MWLVVKINYVTTVISINGFNLSRNYGISDLYKCEQREETVGHNDKERTKLQNYITILRQLQKLKSYTLLCLKVTMVPAFFFFCVVSAEETYGL